MPRNGSGTSSVVNTFVIDTIADPDEVNANFTDVADQLTNSLPRDGQAGMNAPLPLQNGTAALPALTFTSDTDTGVFRKAANTVGISGNGVEAASFGPSGATIGSSPLAGSLYVTKSGNYTAVLADNGSKIRFTAAATLSLTAAATLLSSWSVTVVAGGGAVTIDPNGSETINGLATIIVPNGATAEIVCDGSNFFTVFKPSAWETVGVFSASAASSIIVTDLSGARFLRIKGRISQSASGIIVAQFSTDNGSSYDTAANYFSQSQFAQTATNGASRLATTTGFVLSANGASDASSDLPFSVDIFDFNQAINCGGLVQSAPSIGSSRYVANLSVFHLTTTARNALRILNASGGTITGTIVVEIMR